MTTVKPDDLIRRKGERGKRYKVIDILEHPQLGTMYRCRSLYNGGVYEIVSEDAILDKKGTKSFKTHGYY